MMKEEEKRILSVEEVLHLQSDKHAKTDKIMPDVDTSKYVLNKKPKAEAVRNFVPAVNITEEQRRLFSQGDTSGKSRNAALAEQARNAIKVAEKHAEEEAIEHEKETGQNTEKTDKAAMELSKEIRNGSFDFSFGALIEGSENLKEKI